MKNKLNNIPLAGKVFLYFLIALFGGVLIWVLHINITPWQKLAISILNVMGNDPQSGLGWISNLPIFRGLFESITSISGYLIGTVLFIIIQLCELASFIIYKQDWLLKRVLVYGTAYQEYVPNKKDKGTKKRIKKALSTTVMWAISHLENIRTVAYLIDAGVCFSAYPFIKDVTGIWDLFGVILTAQLDRIDLFSLFLFGITVYGVEMIIKTIWALTQLVQEAR